MLLLACIFSTQKAQTVPWKATEKSPVSDYTMMLQGAVINVSSVGALVPMGSPSMGSYGVAKAAQDQLTKNLAFEFATKGVRVNSVLPGKLSALLRCVPLALHATVMAASHQQMELCRLTFFR